jgi:hypothetical protein
MAMNMTVFRDVAPCSLVETYQRFRGAYCLDHQSDGSLKAVSRSETSVKCYQTTRPNISEDWLSSGCGPCSGGSKHP